MSESFQNEVPPARVNIKLDLHTGGAKKQVELPLRLLVAGDFSFTESDTPLAEREKVSINKNNFDAVLAEMNPTVKLSVPNALADDDSEIPVNLDFKSMKDFHPEQIVQQVPELKSLLAMRNLLRDLKSNILDNAVLRKELEKILQDKNLSDELRKELEAISPIISKE
ncbi:MAG: type VI secretion system contractile sheath small subunit [Snodgrassella sp.]|uniref:Type VI secretion system-associated protein n=1 Tax=Snodgrassella alvi TaxID=1196083 RepID=A0A2N9XJX1_9NEIS|nr:MULTISPECIES: type VI secretion system contractile sheath small subunit [Snodgrassella]MCO6507014.1 type VI secretion system contractile sheath small subunit [Snodgrassella sp.]MCO6514727.1 type VI secretion system contractile sheath small subunit [Snodgrassella sp.]MCO6517334.1 type VI secretion system contractile sheath small subunit [Snodgrassella sp.]MCO6520247.1 type VI secretion system contractile sheath small subunit [Snodgrassella sp.]MCO6525212.1 type VI secretion system contractil